MSSAAPHARTRREAWAAPGSGHDRLLEVMRRTLPAAVGVLVAVLAVWPIARGRDISFVLDKNRVAVSHERLRVTRALYRGRDDKGQPFSLTAGSAVQYSSHDPNVALYDLVARIALSDGPAQIFAPNARYNMTTQKVAVDGPVALSTGGGYKLQTRDVLVDLTQHNATSLTPVTGTMPLGTFAGGRMSADFAQRTVVLTQGARLHIARAAAKAAR